MKTNELAFLKANHVKPLAWRLSRNIGFDGKILDYTLSFTYCAEGDRGFFKVGGSMVDPWQVLHTRRGQAKLYKTADAALSDVRIVQGDQTDVVIYFRDI